MSELTAGYLLQSGVTLTCDVSIGGRALHGEMSFPVHVWDSFDEATRERIRNDLRVGMAREIVNTLPMEIVEHRPQPSAFREALRSLDGPWNGD